jgi:hypothetical protein
MAIAGTRPQRPLRLSAARTDRGPPILLGRESLIMVTKPQIIDAILEINHSASRRWLDAFPRAELRRYLEHLQLTLEPRGPESVWIRSQQAPASSTRAPGP